MAENGTATDRYAAALSEVLFFRRRVRLARLPALRAEYAIALEAALERLEQAEEAETAAEREGVA